MWEPMSHCDWLHWENIKIADLLGGLTSCLQLDVVQHTFCWLVHASYQPRSLLGYPSTSVSYQALVRGQLNGSSPGFRLTSQMPLDSLKTAMFSTAWDYRKVIAVDVRKTDLDAFRAQQVFEPSWRSRDIIWVYKEKRQRAPPTSHT